MIRKEEIINGLCFPIQGLIKLETSKEYRENSPFFTEKDRKEIYIDFINITNVLINKVDDIIPTSKEQALYLEDAIDDYFDDLNFTIKKYETFEFDMRKNRYGENLYFCEIETLLGKLKKMYKRTLDYKVTLERFAPRKKDFHFYPNWRRFFLNDEDAETCVLLMQKEYKRYLYDKNQGLAKNIPNEELRDIFKTYASKSLFEEHYKSSKEMIKILIDHNMDGGKGMWDKKYFQTGWHYE